MVDDFTLSFFNNQFFVNFDYIYGSDDTFFYQGLSKPMLALSIATVFSDESSCDNSYASQDGYGTQSESPSQLSSPDAR